MFTHLVDSSLDWKNAYKLCQSYEQLRYTTIKPKPLPKSTTEQHLKDNENPQN